jgi:hypothetical protein
VNVTPFHIEHLWQIELPADHPWREIRDMGYARYLASGEAYTLRQGGRIAACAGIAPLDRDVGALWSFLARDTSLHLLSFHRIALRIMRVSRFSRLMANTEACFKPGCRWLELLGFEPIDTIAGFGGRENILFARAN